MVFTISDIKSSSFLFFSFGRLALLGTARANALEYRQSVDNSDVGPFVFYFFSLRHVDRLALGEKMPKKKDGQSDNSLNIGPEDRMFGFYSVANKKMKKKSEEIKNEKRAKRSACCRVSGCSIV